MGKWISPNLSQAEDFECLGHSNWTLCSHLLGFSLGYLIGVPVGCVIGIGILSCFGNNSSPIVVKVR